MTRETRGCYFKNRWFKYGRCSHIISVGWRCQNPAQVDGYCTAHRPAGFDVQPYNENQTLVTRKDGSVVAKIVHQDPGTALSRFAVLYPDLECMVDGFYVPETTTATLNEALDYIKANIRI